jgi:hypothetical protein
MTTRSHSRVHAHRRRPAAAALLALTLGATLAACGSSGDPTATSGPGAVPEAEEASGSEASLAGLSAEEICGRIPISALDGVATAKATRSEGYHEGNVTTCSFYGAGPMQLLALVAVVDQGQSSMEDQSNMRSTTAGEDLPEFGAGAFVTPLGKGEMQHGYMAVSKFPNDHIVQTILRIVDPMDKKTMPTKEATIAWHRKVAEAL